MKLNAIDAMSGSPSSWKVLAIMAKDASVRERRLMVSVDEREESIGVISSHCNLRIGRKGRLNGAYSS